ncbi:MAG: alpha-amylase family glycosyl hydrolase, partial [Cytophagales bacterium]
MSPSSHLSKQIIYFILIDRFSNGDEKYTLTIQTKKISDEELSKSMGGTLKGITSNLEYIKNLGCTAIWISPFFKNNPESYHGYAIENFKKVDERFGTIDDLIELSTQCKKLELSLYLDVVINHSGDNWAYQNNTQPIFDSQKTYPFGYWKSNDIEPEILKNIESYERKGIIKNWNNYPETQEGDFFNLKKLNLDLKDHGLNVLNELCDTYSEWIKVLKPDGFRLDTAKHLKPEIVKYFAQEMYSAAQINGINHFQIFIEAPISDVELENYLTVD